MSLATAARKLYNSGLNIIPLLLDGSKAPAIKKWTALHQERATLEQVEEWFSREVGVAVLGGKTSGNLEIMDFDAAELFQPWCDLVSSIDSELIQKLPIVKTPKGYHVYFRTPLCGPNQKLAKSENVGGKFETLIETRGQGGYVIAPPSPAAVHASGVLYRTQQGSITAVPVITDDEHEILFSCARSFNRDVVKEVEDVKQAPSGEGRPGDDFRARASWREVLAPHGWEEVRCVGDTIHWRRPGKKDRGISATTGFCSDMFYSFSSNSAPFEAGRAYNKFSVYAHLAHGSDFSKAASALRKAGYGAKLQHKQAPPPSQGWDELTAPPPEEPKPPRAITAKEIDELLDNDHGAALEEKTFLRLLEARSEPAEWQRITRILMRHKTLKAFEVQAKKHDAKQMAANSDESWRSELIYREAKSGAMVLENCMANHVCVLLNDPHWKGVFAFDEFANQIVTRRPPPFKRSSPQWSDADVLEVKMWIIKNYEMRPTTDAVHEAILTAARQNAYNPLTEYLDNLQSHDKEVLDTWLIDFFGAEDTPYTRALGAKWLIAAVARAYDPGCKVDTVLILEGTQGQKKSSVLDQLCPRFEWFTDGLSDFGSKAQAEEVQGKWIIELGELKGFGREQEQIKAFITRRAENYRPAYARNSVHAPRTCVFAGTVNPDGAGYLRDVSGNRRYWPITCRKKAGVMTPEIRDALWAEARDRYRAKEIWWLEDEELQRAAREEQEKRVHVDAWHDRVAEIVDKTEDTSMNEIMDRLKIDVSKQDTGTTMRIGRIMFSLGWERYQYRYPGGRRGWRYRKVGATAGVLPFRPRPTDPPNAYEENTL